MNISQLVDTDQYPLGNNAFRTQCKAQLEQAGVLVLPDFILPAVIEGIRQDGIKHQQRAFYTGNKHNVYLQPADETFPKQHPRNREVESTKGCITTDQIPDSSDLHRLYHSDEVQQFLCAVLGEAALYEYADPLSSINLHYASVGQELGWHFDNSSFAITLLIQKPENGGVFEYVKNARNASKGDMNYALVEQVLDGKYTTNSLSMNEGTLVLFRGRDSMHRVTPVEGETTRMLVVLAYNTEPGIALSASARQTFYGRLGTE